MSRARRVSNLKIHKPSSHRCRSKTQQITDIVEWEKEIVYERNEDNSRPPRQKLDSCAKMKRRQTSLLVQLWG